MSTNLLTTSESWLDRSSQKLKDLGIDSARLDCLLFLESVLKRSRVQLITNNYDLTEQQLSTLNSMLDRRLKFEPVAYILGHSEFYGRDFIVNQHVLIPRIESEAFISLIIENCSDVRSVIDVGCGSGCLGITLKLELPNISVVGLDISPEALQVAQENANKLSASVDFIQGNLLIDKSKSYEVIVANLPYVPKSITIAGSLAYEPEVALSGGDDGMDFYRKLWSQIKSYEPESKYVLCESLETQHDQMTALAISANYKLLKTESLVQLFSVI